jgi:hypothetical protein
VASSNAANRAGFMLMAFTMSGLIGVFGTFALPVPPIQALRQETVINQALAGGDEAAIDAALSKIKPFLTHEDRKHIAGLPSAKDGLLFAATSLAAETETSTRHAAYFIRLMVITITVLSAIFGVAMLGSGRRQDP